MGLHDPIGLEKAVGHKEMPKTTRLRRVAASAPWGRLVDVMYRVIRRLKGKETLIDAPMAAAILVYQQTILSLWDAAGTHPYLIALCFDRTEDKEMKLLTSLTREARRRLDDAVACQATDKPCPQRGILQTEWISHKTILTEIQAQEKRRDEMWDCLDELPEENVAVEHVIAPIVAEMRNSSVYEFIRGMYHHLLAMEGPPVPVLVSQGNEDIGNLSCSDGSIGSSTWGLLHFPCTTIPPDPMFFLDVCNCSRDTSASARPPRVGTVSTLFLELTLCDAVQRVGSTKGKASVKQLLNQVFKELGSDTHICPHTAASLKRIQDQWFRAIRSPFDMAARRRLVMGALAIRRGDKHAVCIANSGRVGEAELAVARIYQLLMMGLHPPKTHVRKSEKNGTVELAATLIRMLGDTERFGGSAASFVVESVDSDSKILRCVGDFGAMSYRQGYLGCRLVCSPVFDKDCLWWDYDKVVLDLHRHVAHAMLLGLRLQSFKRYAVGTLAYESDMYRPIYVNPRFYNCVRRGVAFITASVLLMGQDCVPDWLRLLGASYEGIGDACLRLLWAATTYFMKDTQLDSKITLEELLPAFEAWMYDHRTGFFTISSEVSAVALAAVAAMTGVSVSTASAAQSLFDHIVGGACSGKRKRESDPSEERPPKRVSCAVAATKLPTIVGKYDLRDCAHLMVRPVKSERVPCETCQRVRVFPVHAAIGTAIGAGPKGGMADEFIYQNIRRNCLIATDADDIPPEKKMVQRLSWEAKGNLARQVVVCTYGLYQSYIAYVIRGESSPLPSTDGRLTFPDSLVAAGCNFHPATVDLFRKFLEVACQYDS